MRHLVVLSPRRRERRSPTKPRPHSISRKELKRGILAGILERVEGLLRHGPLPPRPLVREDCLPGGPNEARPCPWVACKYHLYVDVNEVGSIKFNHPDLEPWQVPYTCALDVAEKPASSEQVSEMLNLTRQGLHVLVQSALRKLFHAVDDDLLRQWVEGQLGGDRTVWPEEF